MRKSIEERRAQQMERYYRDKKAINVRRGSAYNDSNEKKASKRSYYQENRERILARMKASYATKKAKSITLNQMAA